MPKFEQRLENVESEEVRRERLRETTMEIWDALGGDHQELFDSRCTGVDEPLGRASVLNTPLALIQMDFVMAMKEKHPLVQEILSKDFNREAFKLEGLTESKIFSDLKILDLGCGYEPTFARSARYLGADVYTVDVVSADDFVSNDSFPQELKDLEKMKHIQKNLNSLDAPELIMERTGGDFDLVTEAHLFSSYGGIKRPDEYKLPDMSMKWLKKDGIYFSATKHRKVQFNS